VAIFPIDSVFPPSAPSSGGNAGQQDPGSDSFAAVLAKPRAQTAKPAAQRANDKPNQGKSTQASADSEQPSGDQQTEGAVSTTEEAAPSDEATQDEGAVDRAEQSATGEESNEDAVVDTATKLYPTGDDIIRLPKSDTTETASDVKPENAVATSQPGEQDAQGAAAQVTTNDAAVGQQASADLGTEQGSETTTLDSAETEQDQQQLGEATIVEEVVEEPSTEATEGSDPSNEQSSEAASASLTTDASTEETTDQTSATESLPENESAEQKPTANDASESPEAKSPEDEAVETPVAETTSSPEGADLEVADTVEEVPVAEPQPEVRPEESVAVDAAPPEQRTEETSQTRKRKGAKVNEAASVDQQEVTTPDTPGSVEAVEETALETQPVANDSEPSTQQQRDDSASLTDTQPTQATDSRSDAAPVESAAAPASPKIGQPVVGKPAAPADSQSLNRADQNRFVQRVTKAFQTAQREDGSIRLRLSPPELGALRIEVKFQDGALLAQVEAETPSARSLLLDNLPALRERLAEHQIQIEQFDVSLSDEQQTPAGFSDEQQSQREQSSAPSRAGESSTSPVEEASTSADPNAALDVTI